MTGLGAALGSALGTGKSVSCPQLNTVKMEEIPISVSIQIHPPISSPPPADGKVTHKPAAKAHWGNPGAVSPRTDMKHRVKGCLNMYPGVKNSEQLIQQKAEAGRQKLRTMEQEYWAWKQKMQSEAKPRWAFPEDSYAGRRPVEEVIMEKADKAQKVMSETAANYKAWVKDMEKKRQDELTTNLQERQEQLKNFKQQKVEAQRARDASLGEDRDKKAQAAGRYWTWLSDTKNKIDKREVTCAPFVKPSGTRSVEELTQMKRAELAQDVEQREREYAQWVQSIQKPKHVTPWMKCNSVEERDAIIAEQAKKGVARLNQTTVEYNKWLKEMEQANIEKQVAKVREKMAADREFAQNADKAKNDLQKKMADEKRRQQLIQQESQKAVKEMYNRVQARPLQIEQAYRFGRFI